MYVEGKNRALLMGKTQVRGEIRGRRGRVRGNIKKREKGRRGRLKGILDEEGRLERK